MRIQRTVCLALVAGLASGAALAGDPASEAFGAGVADFQEGRYEEAVAQFRRAYQLKPSWKLMFNIGQCEALLKRHGLALQAFEAYLSQGGDDIPEERRQTVLDEVKRLRDVVGLLEVEAPVRAAVLVDGIERGRAPLPGALPLAASVQHEVTVVLIGGQELPPRTVVVMGGQVSRLTFDPLAAREPAEPAPAPAPAPGPLETLAPEPAPAPEAAPPAPEKPAPAEGDGSLRLAGGLVLGAGGALLVAGGITGGAALSLDSDLVDACKEEDCLPERDDSGVAARPVLGPGHAGAVARWRF